MYFEGLTRFLILLVKGESLETSERVDESDNPSALAFNVILRPKIISIRILPTNLQFLVFGFFFLARESFLFASNAEEIQ